MKVFVSGNFNIVHPGHIRLLKYAKKLGSKLIVGVNSDSVLTENIFINEDLRIKNIKDLSFVNEVFLVKNLKTTLFKIRPDIIVKGKEFRSVKNHEEKYLKKLKAKLIFGSGAINYSTSELFKREIRIKPLALNLPKDFIHRHKIKKDKIIKYIESFNNLRTCVIGDIIVDEYINSNLLGSSNEEPCLVINPYESKKFLGGAGIVACHSSKLGAETKLLSIIGPDKNGKLAVNQLKKNDVNHHLNQDISRPTTLKKRFKVDNKSIIKVSYLNQDPISKIDQNFIFEKLNKNIKKIDLIILSDFNYGCLPQNLVEKIIKIAKKNKIFVSADSQSSSQIGDIARFKNIDLITPTEKEARIGVKNNTDGLVVLINKLQKITKTKNIILTLAADGILIQKKIKKIKNFIHTDKIPAINKNPKDVSGAGDALLVMSSLMLASGSSIWEASFAGSLFAALQANSIGNTPINKKTFLELIRLSMDH